MSNTAQVLNQKSLVIIFAYAAAGLGHLRVTEALYKGLPENISPILLRSQDQSTSALHKLTSSYPLAKSILEWSQSGWPEEIFNKFYLWFLNKQTKLLYQQMSTILDERINLPKTVLVVATHFGLAHQLAAIKENLANDKYVKIFLIVQVTDDSPQHIWFVPKADLTFVPSEQTKKDLFNYAKVHRSINFNCEVLPYPINPLQSDLLIKEEFIEKANQLNPLAKTIIHVSIPISGAAVGMNFTTSFIDELHQRSNRFLFHLTCKSNKYTQNFLSSMLNRPTVDLNVSPSSREIIDKYEGIYQKKIISLEITKPSEQCFKALFNPRQRGGSLLLLTQPVGRQEYDNLNFLRRHHLIPLPGEQKYLFERAKLSLPLDSTEKISLLKKARHWRAVTLPADPKESAQFVWWLLSQEILLTMIRFFSETPNINHKPELGSDGVRKFWQKIASFLVSN